MGRFYRPTVRTWLAARGTQPAPPAAPPGHLDACAEALDRSRGFCGICCQDTEHGGEECPELALLRCERCGGFREDGRVVLNPCECEGARVGRRYVPSEGGGGYFLGAYGQLWHAPLREGRLRWDEATWTHGLMEGHESDPGWDFARHAERILRGAC